MASGRETPVRQTRAYIDLDAITENIQTLRSRIGEAKLLVSVKSDGYGHGAVAVARECERAGVDMAAVANLEEGVALRSAGITLPILVLENLFPDEIGAALEADLRLSIGDLEYGHLISRAAVERVGRPAVVHVNVETGMGRMGIYGADSAAIVEELSTLVGLEIEGIFSHFPSSDELEKDYSHRQLDRFSAIADDIDRRGVNIPLRHIANSGAVLDFPGRSSLSMVRIGVALYGMYPAPEADHSIPLKPVMRIVSRIIKVTRHLEPATVGYGRTYPVDNGSVIAVVPIGYGDGYRRGLAKGGTALVHGMRVPVAGRVSMDMIALDLTALPEGANFHDEVVLMGPQSWTTPSGEERHDAIDAEEIAAQLDTITYEITCGLTPRVPRVYHRSGTVEGVRTMSDGYGSIRMYSE